MDLQFFSVCMVFIGNKDNDYVNNMRYFLSLFFFLYSAVMATDSVSVSQQDLQKAKQHEKSIREKLQEKKNELAPYLDEEGNLKQGAPANAAKLQQNIKSSQAKLDVLTGLIQKAQDHLDSSRR